MAKYRFQFSICGYETVSKKSSCFLVPWWQKNHRTVSLYFLISFLNFSASPVSLSNSIQNPLP
jgi:hypothetical protein